MKAGMGDLYSHDWMLFSSSSLPFSRFPFPVSQTIWAINLIDSELVFVQHKQHSDTRALVTRCAFLPFHFFFILFLYNFKFI